MMITSMMIVDMMITCTMIACKADDMDDRYADEVHDNILYDKGMHGMLHT